MSLQLNDQQTLEVIQQLYKIMENQENQKLLDIDHLDTFKRREIKPLYPHKFATQNDVRVIQKYACCDIGELSSGSTCCACFRQIKPPDKVFQQFGLGANMHFNFMKHFSSCFIFLGLLSIIAIAICYYVALTDQINPTSNYQTFFFATTMGSFSASSYQCSYANSNSLTYTFNLFCNAGTIFQFGPVLTSNSQVNIQNCKQQRQKYQQQMTSYYINPSSYSISRSSCSSSFCIVTVTFSTQPSTTVISYPYSCQNPSYAMFNTKIEDRVLIYIVVGIDLFITISLLFFLCSQKDGQNQQIDYFKNFQLTLKDFSVKLNGFNSATFDQQFEDLIQTINKREINFDQRIVQIKTPEDQSFVRQRQSRADQYQELFKFMERNFFDSLINPNQFQTSNQLVDNIFTSPENYQEFKKQLEELLEKFINSQSIGQRKIQDISIYLVLNSSSDITTLKRMQTKSCCSKYILSRSKKQYTIEEAPIPDMLQERNRPKWTTIRVIISWILTLIIVAGSYIFFGWIQWEQKRLLSNYNFNIDCTLYYTNLDYITFSSTDYNASPNQYIQCYCSSNYFSFNTSSQVTSHCSQWWRSYVLYLIIPILISLGLVLYNLIVSTIFKKITQFEAHYLLSNQLFSYTIKRSFILIMNMGLIIVLLNFNYTGNIASLNDISFLFQGQYQDFTSDWYITIGSIIIMTMLFNISFPFMELFMLSMFKCFRKCFDKRCWTRKTSQRYKSDYINLYSGDIYPIQERYALIISIFFITLTFNCVIPFLNIIAALSFGFLQLIDKLLVFKFFKTPLNFDQGLHNKFMKSLYAIMIIHTVVTAFLLTEPNLLAPNSSFSSFSALSSSNNRLNTMIQTYYVLPYLAILVVLVVYAVFKSTILQLLAVCNKKIERSMIYKLGNSQSFYQSLSEHQLFRLKGMVEKEINRLQVQKRKPSKQTLYTTTEQSELYINPYKSDALANERHIQIRIFRKTHETITKHLQLYRKNQVSQRKIKLIGLPGYELSLHQNESDKQKRILLLDSVLEQIFLKRGKVPQ